MNNNRVLSRRGARVLTQEELEVIAGSGGGPIGCTQVCTNRPTNAGMGFQCDSECPKGY